MVLFSPLDFTLLKKPARQENLKVFLCGPGYSHPAITLRTAVKEFVELDGVSEVIYGEDLELKKFDYLKSRIRKRDLDLQTLESYFAHTTDLIILLLSSPGSIAELGTFAMIDSLRPRLYVLLSESYYKSESYIARGPLAILSSEFQNNVIYYDSAREAHIGEYLNYPILLHKYIKYSTGLSYIPTARDAQRRDKFNAFFSVKRLEFLAALTLMCIVILEQPTFAEILQHLSFGPDVLNSALKELHKKHAIKKMSSGAYVATRGYGDSLLDAFDGSAISKRRAQILATA